MNWLRATGNLHVSSMSSARPHSGPGHAAFRRSCGSSSSSRFHSPPRRRFSPGSSNISKVPSRLNASLRLASPPCCTLGFTRQKARYVAGLARQLHEGAVSLERIARLPDADAGQVLVQIPGIGPWTASVYLLMALRRPDVWPPGDLGLHKSMAEVRGMCAVPTSDAGRSNRRALESVARRRGTAAVALLPVPSREGVGPTAPHPATVAESYLMPSNRNAVRPCGRWIGSTRSSRSTGE